MAKNGSSKKWIVNECYTENKTMNKMIVSAVVVSSLISLNVIGAERAVEYVNARDERGLTALHRAVAREPEQLDLVMRELGRPGVNVNIQDNVGNTALHMAAFLGYINSATVLVKVGS